MSSDTIADFIRSTAQDSAANRPFEVENPYTLEVNLNNRLVWAKLGSMIAYTGQVKFTREGVMEHGLERMLKKMVTGEGNNLMKMEGVGRVYLADRGSGESIQLAFEGSGWVVLQPYEEVYFQQGSSSAG